MNFVTKTDRTQPFQQPQIVAAHHQDTGRPLARHAYRLSQVITYGFAAPQTFVH